MYVLDLLYEASTVSSNKNEHEKAIKIISERTYVRTYVSVYTQNQENKNMELFGRIRA